MKIRLTKTAQAVAQAVACFAVVGCGGGSGSSTETQASTVGQSGAASSAPVEQQAQLDVAGDARAQPLASTVSTASLSVDVVSATGGTLLPFTVGQPLKQGEVPNGSVLVADVPNSQFVVKNRWPDGSAKFAILSGRADMSANTWKTIGLSVVTAAASATAVSTADLKVTGVTATVQFGSFGTASWNAGDWDTPTKTWVSGPEMSAFIYRKPIGSDAHLVAWLEVRAYKGGRIEVMPWIENGYLNVSGAMAKSGTAAFTLGGTQRFSQALNLLNHQRAVLASGTTLTHWVGGDPQVTPRHNTAYLMATKLVPNYRGTTSASSSVFNRMPSSYTPLAQANYADDMGQPGYFPAIGLLPEWDVAYLTSSGDPRAWRGVFISALAAGRYGTHFRDEKTNRPLRFSSYPSLVLDGSSGVADTGSSVGGSYTPGASGVTPPTYDSPHHPSMGYMAYLLTGWNYFLEETQLLAATNFLKQSDNKRLYGKGVFETSSGTNTTRGAAWALRTLAQATAITPDDDDVLRTEFVNSVTENINYYYGRYITVQGNTLGLTQPYSSYDASGPWTSASWMEDFFTAAWGYTKDLQVFNPTVGTKFDQFLTWKYRSIVGRLGGSGIDQFAFPYAGQYTVNYAPNQSVDWANGAGPWYASWGAVARAMSVPTIANTGDSLVNGYPESPEGYWSNLMPAISYAVDHGAAGAANAWSRIVAAPNFATQAATYNNEPVWGVMPR